MITTILIIILSITVFILILVIRDMREKIRELCGAADYAHSRIKHFETLGGGLDIQMKHATKSINLCFTDHAKTKDLLDALLLKLKLAVMEVPFKKSFIKIVDCDDTKINHNNQNNEQTT